MKNGEREGALDFLKIVATILILLHHFQQLFNVSYGPVEFYGGKFYFGSMVELFFIISGYLTYKWTDKIINHETEFGLFVKRKCVRLLPIMAIGVVIYEILIFAYKHIYFTLFWGTQDINASEAVLEFLGIQKGWVTKESLVINNPTWYVSVLLLCYVVFYLTTVLALHWNTEPIYLYIFMALLGLGVLNYNINLPFINISSGRGFFNFFLGILLAKYISKYGISVKLMVIAIGAILFTLLLIQYQIRNYGEYTDNTWLSLGFYPSIIIIFKNKFFDRLFNHKWIASISSATYDTYILHMNLILILMCIRGLRENLINIDNVLTEIVFIILALIVGILTYRCIEQPIVKYLNKKMNM